VRLRRVREECSGVSRLRIPALYLIALAAGIWGDENAALFAPIGALQGTRHASPSCIPGDTIALPKDVIAAVWIINQRAFNRTDAEPFEDVTAGVTLMGPREMTKQ
jgi:hypothetical protein